MKKIVSLFLCVFLGLGLSLIATSAEAVVKKHHARHHHHITHKTSASASTKARVRTAQKDLTILGYKPGPADGILGKKTAAAIKAFQKDHDLHVDDKLTKATYDLIVKEARKTKPETVKETSVPPAPAPDFFATHPDFYGYYNENYANPVMLNSPQSLTTRYGNLQIAQNGGSGSERSYSVTLENQALITTNHQPAPILISKTYTVGDEDAIIITSYSGDNRCSYVHDLLILSSSGHRLQRMDNCTYKPDAQVSNGNLFISFPESNGDVPTGATWRYENGMLEKL